MPGPKVTLAVPQASGVSSAKRAWANDAASSAQPTGLLVRKLAPSIRVPRLVATPMGSSLRTALTRFKAAMAPTPDTPVVVLPLRKVDRPSL
jgi:hypothetical protein